MKRKATFYHAGCPVCIGAEQTLAAAIDTSRFDVEVVHLGKDRGRVAEARMAGVKSVPAIVIDAQPYHINFGASLSDLEK